MARMARLFPQVPEEAKVKPDANWVRTTIDQSLLEDAIQQERRERQRKELVRKEPECRESNRR